jgi:hypothetical protein
MTLKIGCGSPKYIVYCENQPNLDYLGRSNSIGELYIGQSVSEISLSSIIEHNGNHWRKIFNIYAKIGWALTPNQATTWQEYRDQVLLTNGSSTQLVMGASLDICIINAFPNATHLVMGKQYFKSFLDSTSRNKFEPINLQILDVNAFKFQSSYIINTPYFDYRQFNNCLIDSHVNCCTQLENH